MQKRIRSYDDLPLILSAEDIAEFLSISRAGAYALLHKEGVPVLKVGRRLLIPRDGFLDYIHKEIEGKPWQHGE